MSVPCNVDVILDILNVIGDGSCFGLARSPGEGNRRTVVPKTILVGDLPVVELTELCLDMEMVRPICMLQVDIVTEGLDHCLIGPFR